MVNDNILMGFVYICTSSNYYVSPYVYCNILPMIYESKKLMYTFSQEPIEKCCIELNQEVLENEQYYLGTYCSIRKY